MPTNTLTDTLATNSAGDDVGFYIFIALCAISIIYVIFLGIMKVIRGFISIFRPHEKKSTQIKISEDELKEEYKYEPYFPIRGLKYTGTYKTGWYVGKLEAMYNKHDPYAIAVVHNKEGRIGWVPRENKVLYQMIKEGTEFYGVIEISDFIGDGGKVIQYGRFHISKEEFPTKTIKNFKEITDPALRCTWSEGIKID